MKHLIEQLESFTEAKLGSGERYKKLVKDLESKGVDDPKALAAWIGRKKYGKKKFQALAKKGQKRAMGEEDLSEDYMPDGMRGVRNWDKNSAPPNFVKSDDKKGFLTVASLLLLKTRTPGVVEFLERGKWQGGLDLRDIEKRVKKSLEFRLKQEAVMVRDTLNEAIADGFMEDWQLRDAMKDIYRALESVRREINGVRVSKRDGITGLLPVFVVSAPRLNEQAAKYEDTRSDVFNKVIGYP